MQETSKSILLVHGSNDLYGASKIFLNIIDSLQKTGLYDIHVILPYKGVLDKLLQSKGINVNHKNLGVLRKKYFNICGLFDRGAKIIKASLYIRNYIKTHKIDLVYTNTSVILSTGIAARMSGSKSLIHIHDTPANNGIYSKAVGFLLEILSDKVITVSNAVSQHYSKHISENKLVQIYNSVEVPDKINWKRHNSTPPFKMICVGRLSPLKGHDYLIDIIVKLKELNPNLTLEIIGDVFRGYENYEASLLKKVKDLELTELISFTGFVNNMEEKYKSADLLIHPSILPDSLPTVILEAMSYGVPVVATDLGGAKELLQKDENGLLIPFNNANIASEKINTFVQDRKEQQKCIENAHNNLKSHFTPSKFSERINQTVLSL
jgi:glycosyltransferase involved in cell wall biosynthesis